MLVFLLQDVGITYTFGKPVDLCKKFGRFWFECISLTMTMKRSTELLSIVHFFTYHYLKIAMIIPTKCTHYSEVQNAENKNFDLNKKRL